MLRKSTVFFSLLIALSMVLTACGGAAPAPSGGDGEGEVVVQEVTRIVEVTPEGGGEEMPPAQVSGQGEILQRVVDRGTLVCGGRTDLAGFGFLNEDGRNVGFDIDICRAVAAALLGDPEAVEIVPLTAAERGPALQTGEVDLLSRNVTWTSSRDAQWGNFSATVFYDGQGFMVPVASGIESADQLDGATVCVTSGTTTELNLADFFRQRGMELETVVFEDTATVYGTYEDGRCDATTSDKSQLASVRTGFEDPSAHAILDITISKEPLTPAVPSGDDQWFDLVKLVVFGLINAEELGVTQANVEDMKSSDNIAVRRLLGSEGEWGQADVGLPADAVARAVTAVGNYGEIYDRYLGPEGLDIPRGPNRLWTEGGILYAPPMR